METIPFGFCHCGCGQKTKIARGTNEHGHVKGQPLRFLMNHCKRKKGTYEDAQPFKIDGIYCRLIPLSRDLWAIVDEADYVWLSQYKWFALFAKHTGAYYAARKEKETRELIRMHRQILGLELGNPLEGDHIYPFNTLDNRRKNLRIVTPAQQLLNRRKDWKPL